MPKLLRNALALIAGVATGSVVNMAIIMMGPAVISPPPGADMMTAEGIKAALPLLEPKHFLMPFLAHAVGTLAGALVGAVLAVTRREVVGYAVGILFLCGGIGASFMIPAPTWFIVLDLVAAYMPMAWLGLSIAAGLKPAVTK